LASPHSTWGESFLLLLQGLIIGFLILKTQSRVFQGVLFVVLFLAYAFALLNGACVCQHPGSTQ
jgi:Ca2+/Na+ antiporter